MNDDTSALAKQTFQILAHAVAGESARAADLLTDLGNKAGAAGMYGVCCGFASAAAQSIRKLYGDENTDGFLYIEELKPGALSDDPHQAFAARFITAFANGDEETTFALYRATLTGDMEQHIESVCQLVADTAGICRLAIEKKGQQQ